MYHQAVRDHFLGPTKPGLLIVRAAVGVLLLMSCANIANLLLIRASAREQEIAIRRALGVSPAHVAASADRGRCPCGNRWRRRSDDRVVGNLAAGGQWSGRDVDRSGITIKGRPLDNPAAAPDADRFGVRPEYFETMRIPLVRGRLLDETDSREAAAVAVIGKTMAEQLWPGEDPIGHRIRVGGGPTNPMRTIVGIVGDARHYGLHMPATSQVYVPHTQGHYPEPMMAVVVRVGGRNSLGIAPAVREQVRALDPLQPVTDIQTYDAIVGESMATRRFTLLLLALFAATALILAIVGLYGALSYVVTQRQREIGVRVALGAASRDISRLIVGQGMQPVVVGLAAGLALSPAMGRLLETMIYGVSPTDATTFAGVLTVVAGSALAACVIPARRAARIDPAVTLRAE